MQLKIKKDKNKVFNKNGKHWQFQLENLYQLIMLSRGKHDSEPEQQKPTVKAR